MGNSILHIEGNTLKLTPGLRMLILYKKPRHQHYTSNDYSVYRAIVAHTRVRAYPNKCTGSARPRSTWKWKHMLRGMAIPADRVEEEDGVTEGTSSDDYWTPPPDFVPASDLSPPPFIGKTRKRMTTREAWRNVSSRSIKGLTDKLHLLLAEFFAVNTTFRNELVHVLDALLRLKQRDAESTLILASA